MNWLTRILPSVGSREQKPEAVKSHVPEGLWQLCPSCEQTLYRPELEENLKVCSKCGFHFRMNARERLAMLLQDAPSEEIMKGIKALDRLKFRDTRRYKDRLTEAVKGTGEEEALICMKGQIEDIPVVICAFEFGFMGGSMSAAVGEKFVGAARYAGEHGLPLVSVAMSGGARMQESMFSLLQMARTAAVLQWLKERGRPYISILADPVYGGVSASLAMLGDVIIAEPGVRVGFTGPRVIEQTMRLKLPAGFQKSEFLLEYGAIDMIVPRAELRVRLASLLGKLIDAGA